MRVWLLALGVLIVFPSAALAQQRDPLVGIKELSHS